MTMATTSPGKVFGIHFTNPVPTVKPVEVVKTFATSKDTVNIAKQFTESLGKTVIMAEDTLGLLGNRLLFPHLLNCHLMPFAC